MRLLMTSAALLIAASAAHAGSLSSASDPVVTQPGTVVVQQPECSGVLVGGCGYCIGGKIYHL